MASNLAAIRRKVVTNVCGGFEKVPEGVSNVFSCLKKFLAVVPKVLYRFTICRNAR